MAPFSSARGRQKSIVANTIFGILEVVFSSILALVLAILVLAGVKTACTNPIRFGNPMSFSILLRGAFRHLENGTDFNLRCPIDASQYGSSIYSSSEVALLLNTNLIPLFSYAGTDIWESYSAAGVINPFFGVMIGAPIGALGMFKGGLKKLFPEQVKTLDWTDMDVAGSRSRFQKYKAFTSDDCAIDNQRNFNAYYFRQEKYPSEKWRFTGQRTIRGAEERPLGEYLHGTNDDLLHLGPHETVVTDITVLRFNSALLRNACVYVVMSVLALDITATPVVACYLLPCTGPVRQAAFIELQVWVYLAWAYTILSAASGTRALWISTRKQYDRGKSLVTYWQTGAEQYRMGTYYNQGPTRVQNGLYSPYYRVFAILQGSIGICLAIAASIALVTVTDAIIWICVASGMSWRCRLALCLPGLVIILSRFLFILPSVHSTLLVPKLSGQAILIRLLKEAFEASSNISGTGNDDKVNRTEEGDAKESVLTTERDGIFRSSFLAPLRLNWLEGHRAVFKTTLHGGYYQHLPTKMIFERCGKIESRISQTLQGQETDTEPLASESLVASEAADAARKSPLTSQTESRGPAEDFQIVRKTTQLGKTQVAFQSIKGLGPRLEAAANTELRKTQDGGQASTQPVTTRDGLEATGQPATPRKGSPSTKRGDKPVQAPASNTLMKTRHGLQASEGGEKGSEDPAIIERSKTQKENSIAEGRKSTLKASATGQHQPHISGAHRTSVATLDHNRSVQPVARAHDEGHAHRTPDAGESQDNCYRVILPATCIIDGQILRQLASELRQANSAPRKEGQNEQRFAWLPWRKRDPFPNIDSKASYFLRFEIPQDAVTKGVTKGTAVRIPSEPWISSSNATKALMISKHARASVNSKVDAADAHEDICVVLHVERKFVNNPKGDRCPRCPPLEEEGTANEVPEPVPVEDGDEKNDSKDTVDPAYGVMYRQHSSRPRGIGSRNRLGEVVVRWLPGFPINLDDKPGCCLSLIPTEKRISTSEAGHGNILSVFRSKSQLVKPLSLPCNKQSSLRLAIHPTRYHLNSQAMLSMTQQDEALEWAGGDIWVVDV